MGPPGSLTTVLSLLQSCWSTSCLSCKSGQRNYHLRTRMKVITIKTGTELYCSSVTTNISSKNGIESFTTKPSLNTQVAVVFFFI